MSNYCPKCGNHFFVHNDDGSCIDEAPEFLSTLPGRVGTVLNSKKSTLKNPQPSLEQLEEWSMDSVCEATDGCIVEHDGTCPHGHRSWFLELGLI
jgi:hypothetical protein